jgi:DNA-binding NarL/FixJ family response regulator
MKSHVLLIEDEPDARASLACAIERAGYACTAVGSREEALTAARTGPFVDLIVTDIVLDRDDRGGLDLIPAIRKMGIEAPIIVITAFADVAKVKFALNAGAAYMLEKPFRAAELLEAFRQVLATPPDVGHHVERTLQRCGLTEKERVIARHVLRGLSSVEIAGIENNSERTVRQHISQIYAKCGVSSRGGFFRFVLPIGESGRDE